jgi:hypothetical protein
MFAPKVAKPPTKAAARPTSKLAPQRSTLVARPLGGAMVEQALPLQRTIGNQATLRYMTHRLSNLPSKDSAEPHEREADPEKDFSKVPVFPPEPANPLHGPPVLGILPPKLAIGPVNDPLEREADTVADRVMRMPDLALPISTAPAESQNVLMRKPSTASTEHEVTISSDAAQGISNLRGTGSELPQHERDYFEPRFGCNLSEVRVHTGREAERLARQLGARAFTLDRDIVFGPNEFAPGKAEGRWLLAHELAHVAQQVARTAPSIQRQPDPLGGGPSDAGVEPLPGGVPPTAEELEQQRLQGTAPADLADIDLGPAYEAAYNSGDQQRATGILDQIRQRDWSFGVALPLALPRGQGASALVTPDIALAMIENMIAGRPAFRPELGVGGASWFVSEGTPYTGVGSGHTVPVQVDLIDTSGGQVFDQAILDEYYAQEEARARPQVEAEVRARFRVRSGRDAPPQLSNALIDRVERQLRGLAERRMWERIGREVAASGSKVGEVILPPMGRFSTAPGRFKIVADAAKIRVRGGVMSLIDALRPSASPVPALEAEAAALARSLRLAGQVRTVFRVGGKIVIVVAIAVDFYSIIVAEDKVEAVLSSVGGWAGAYAAGAAFAAWWTPADVAGPWAWAGHGVGTLIAGGVGYWVGSGITRTIYRLVVVNQGTVGTASP